MGKTQDEAGPIAILVVHGMGAQEPGERSRKLMAGLARVDRSLDPSRSDGVITVGGQPVRLYEVYWATQLKGDITRGAFQMTELQSVSWFPWFNYRRHNYQPGSYSLLKLAWWWVTLPIFNFFALFAYQGARFVAQLASGAKSRRTKEDGSLWDRVKDASKSVKPTAIDRILDEYVGDVFSYVNSARNAFHREEDEAPIPDAVEHVYAPIVQRFYDQLLNAQADGCTEILKVRRLYTVGSPLGKIKFFWPTLTPGGPALGGITIQWDNFVSWFDPVAGTLTRFGDWGKVFNHRLLGGGFLRGHVVYEHSPVFLGVLTRGLCGHELPFARTREEQWRDRLVLAGETLFAPAAAALVLTCGMALFLLAALLLPFLASLILRQFLPEQTWVSIENRSALVFIGLMVLVFVLNPVIRASRVQRLYWIATPSVERK